MTNTRRTRKEKIQHAVDIGMGWENVWFLSNSHKTELLKSQKYGGGGGVGLQFNCKGTKDRGFW